MATTKIYSVTTGHRVAAGTEWPIQTIVYRVQCGQSRPHWVVSEGVCQGVAQAAHTYRTRREAFARANGGPEASRAEQWVVVRRIPQVDGGVRAVLVERRHAAEVREAIRQDPSRIDRLWCPVRTRDAGTKGAECP